jgi:deoxyribonuclease V
VRVWPSSAQELVAEQERLARIAVPPWRPLAAFTTGGCFVCSARGMRGSGTRGDPLWAAAASGAATAVVEGEAGAPYAPGLLALREGPVLEAAVRALANLPDVLLIDATGHDHPRRAGLALHLGSVLELPTIGVTHRPLVAGGEWPPDVRGARSPLLIDGELVGFWLRTRAGARPLAVHAGWRTDAEAAVDVVLACAHRRTPEPLRRARRLARTARAREDWRVSSFTLKSSAFEHGQPIPQRYTCDGDDVSPPLEWSGVPDGARSLALVVDDPDAPRGTFTHWVASGIDPASSGLAEGEAAPSEGTNDFGTTGWRGPCPPPGHGRHRYVFRLRALDGEERVLDTAELIGTYER